MAFMDILSALGMWPWVILICCLLISVLYWYNRTLNGYWEKKGIPFIPAWLLLGNLSIFFGKVQHEVDLARYKKYGRLLGMYEAKTRVLMLADPDLLRNILVKDFQSFPSRRVFQTGDPIADSMLSIVKGEKWKRIRTIISPAFSTGKIRRMTDIILTSAKAVTQNIARSAGKPIDGKEFFGAFTMDVIASTAFATKINSFQDPNNEFLQHAKQAFPKKIALGVLIFVLIPKILKAFGVSVFSAKPLKFFVEASLNIIKERRKTGKVGNDFLQLLMDAEKETTEQEQEKLQEKEEIEKTTDDINAEELGHDENNAQIFKRTGQLNSLSHDELIAQCVIFFLAGYETTASTLAFVAYELALNPEIQDKLSQEVDAVITKHNGKLTYEGIQEMKYLDKVISETLRMFPAGVRIERLANEDYQLGDSDITIEKGTIVVAPVYAIHHDPEFYPNPEKFDPERFSPEEKAERHPYTYLTFGAGPRNCIGMRFALMEIKLCIAYLASQLRIKRCPETPVPLEFFSGIGLLHPKPIFFTVEKRENRVFDGLTE